MPATVGSPQEKVFERELRLTSGKDAGAGWARYPRVGDVGQSRRSDDLIKRPAMRADEINLRGLDEWALGRLQRGGRATVTLT